MWISGTGSASFTSGSRRVRPGEDGNYRDIKLKRSMAQPSTPTGNSPTGWTEIVKCCPILSGGALMTIPAR